MDFKAQILEETQAILQIQMGMLINSINSSFYNKFKNQLSTISVNQTQADLVQKME